MVKPLFAVVPVEMWAGVSLVRHILRPLCYTNHGRRRAARGGIQSCGVIEVYLLADGTFGCEATSHFVRVDELVLQRPP